MVVSRKDGLRGVYDIESDSLTIPFEYSTIELFGNLAQLTKDDTNYEIIDLDSDETLQTTKQRAFENLSDELKERLNLAKVDLEDYMTLFDTPKTEQDLRKIGLWSTKVGVLDVPSAYSEIIEEHSGNIEWEYPVSADVFDMHVELPVIFKKRDGEYVTLGIKHENIVLEDRTILNDVKLPKKSEKNDSQELPNQAEDFKEFIQAKYYPYKEDDATMEFEGYLFKTLYSEPMKFIPDYFNQILAQFRDYYDAKNDEHQQIALHLARRFGLLVNSLHVIQKAQNEPYDGLEWFLATFVEEIKKVDGYEILSDDILIFYMMNTFSSIIEENDQSYITSMIEVVKELMKFYPYLSDSFLYALQELMKSVALKEISVDNANRFLEIFEELPKLYDKLSYTKTMELKDMINGVLANDKPQDNKVFDEDGVKNRLILLNYLVDMEDFSVI